jgi:hypothetical protein
MDFSACPDDESFGPAVRGCRGDFDFTITFEKIFFSLIPAPIFIAFALCRIVYLARKQAIVGGLFLRSAKLVRQNCWAQCHRAQTLMLTMHRSPFSCLPSCSSRFSS